MFFIAAAACVSLTASAQRNDQYDGRPAFSGEELYNWCRSADPIDRRACAVYMCGLNDGWSASLMIDRKRPYRFCPRQGVLCQRLGEVALKYLEAHPADRGEPAAKLGGYALQDAFPCHGRYWIEE